VHPLSVLIVDDEEDFLETIVRRLQRRNIDVIGVRSGEEALLKLRERVFQVIVLDVKMPGGMDGIETLREIKKMSPQAHVILLTGHGSVEMSVEGMKLGAFDYVMKPVKLENLLCKISDAMKAGGANGRFRGPDGGGDPE
jgi:DNA-binding NtrC family response regulator